MADGRFTISGAVTPRPLVDQVVEAIVQAAAQGQLLPGDRLKEREIALELNVSRLPVREALHILASQGLAVSSPYKGMKLAEFDSRQLNGIARVRASLEALALEDLLHAYRQREMVMDKMTAIVEAMGRAARGGERFEVVRLDTQFHRELCASSDNEVLLQLWETLALRLTLFFGLWTSGSTMISTFESHRDLLDVFKQGDDGRAQAALQSHIVGDITAVDYEALIEDLRAKRALGMTATVYSA